MRREYNARAWLAWHTAALVRAKPSRFPKLRDMMLDEPGRRRRQSVDEQVAIAKAWHAAFIAGRKRQ